MPGFIKSLLVTGATLALTAGAAQADIVIGLAGPITGQLAVFGEQLKRGGEKAVSHINAHGGVLGQQLQVVLGDDACDPKQAVAVANKMANAGAVFVAGHFCSGSSIPASDVYHEEGILQISPASTNPKLTEQGYANVFRVCGRDDVQGPDGAKYILAHHLGTKIAVVHDKSAYGKGLADAAKATLNAAGVQEVMYEAINAGDKDFSALVTKMKAAGVDLIYFGGYHPEAGLIVRQSHEQGLNAVLMGGDALFTQEFWSITGDTGEGALMTFMPDAREYDIAKPIVEEFRADGYEPEAYTLFSYAAVQAWAQAAEIAGTTDLEPVIKALKSNEFDTVLGKLRFDQNGDPVGVPWTVYRWHDGTYSMIAD